MKEIGYVLFRLDSVMMIVSSDMKVFSGFPTPCTLPAGILRSDHTTGRYLSKQSRYVKANGKFAATPLPQGLSNEINAKCLSNLFIHTCVPDEEPVQRFRASHIIPPNTVSTKGKL
jgi:hypothetical protein